MYFRTNGMRIGRDRATDGVIAGRDRVGADQLRHPLGDEAGGSMYVTSRSDKVSVASSQK